MFRASQDAPVRPGQSLEPFPGDLSTFGVVSGDRERHDRILLRLWKFLEIEGDDHDCHTTS